MTVYRTTTQFYTGDTRTPTFINPQEHNRYTYALNNPLRYTDPDGHQVLEGALVPVGIGAFIAFGIYYYCVVVPALEQQGVDTSISDAISYAWNETKAKFEQAGKAISGFFKNFLPKKDNDEKQDDKNRNDPSQRRGNVEPSPQPPKYPGDDPTKPPGPGYEWRGKGEVGSGQGRWYNPDTGESFHPDVNHPYPKGPHWGYRDPLGRDFDLFPDGRIEPR